MCKFKNTFGRVRLENLPLAVATCHINEAFSPRVGQGWQLLLALLFLCADVKTEPADEREEGTSIDGVGPFAYHSLAAGSDPRSPILSI